jgi:hypothetical protein
MDFWMIPVSKEQQRVRTKRGKADNGLLHRGAGPIPGDMHGQEGVLAEN